MRRAGTDNRRIDVRQEKQPINESNILSEYGQALPTLGEKSLALNYMPPQPNQIQRIQDEASSTAKTTSVILFAI
jgi:hypothetical protein